MTTKLSELDNMLSNCVPFNAIKALCLDENRVKTLSCDKKDLTLFGLGYDFI